jgi:hypothetical protein
MKNEKNVSLLCLISFKLKVAGGNEIISCRKEIKYMVGTLKSGVFVMYFLSRN